MLIDVEHRMKFKYTDFIRESQMEIRVEPRTSDRQSLHSFQMAVGPEASVNRYIDWNDNWVHHLAIRHYHDQIEVIARSLVETSPALRSMTELNQLRPGRASGPMLDFIRFCGPVERSEGLEVLAEEFPFSLESPMGELLEATGQVLHAHLEYRQGSTTWKSTVSESLELGAGVCQDFAHAALALLRLREIPCRYVGGYLHGDQLISQGHAWIEVYTGEDEWVAYDPTHRCLPGEDHVTVARGRTYDDVTPNRGVYRGQADEALHAEVWSQEAQSLDIVTLRRQLEGIEVPVYAELPSLGKESRLSVEHQQSRDSEEPQQQQQQQQR